MRLRIKRAIMKSNALFAAALAILLAVMINFLAAGHRVRLDFSPDSYYSLSQSTLGMLERLPGVVEIDVLLDINDEIFPDVKRLLKEYEYASDKIKVEYVDPHRDLARAKELALKYNIPCSDVVIFHTGDRTRVVAASELASYDYKPLPGGQSKTMNFSKTMVSFCGEQAFSSAIFSIIQDKKPLVYFLGGHGEQLIDDFGQNSGYSMIARLMERGNMQAGTLSLADNPSIPKDCDLLIIAGQKKPMTHIEADVIEKYLDNSGRLMLLADSGVETGLEKILESWGVRLGLDRVVGTTLTGRELLINNYGDHPITEKLKNTITIFNLPRSVRPLASAGRAGEHAADKPDAIVLAANSEEGWAEMSPYQNPPRLDAGVDTPGPVPVAVAVEKGNLPADVEIKPTRLVVIGDSSFVANGSLLAGYSPDFFINSVNWLLERTDAPTFAPKIPSKISLKLDRRRMLLTYIITVVALPALVGMLWLVVLVRRRR